MNPVQLNRAIQAHLDSLSAAWHVHNPMQRNIDLQPGPYDDLFKRVTPPPGRLGAFAMEPADPMFAMKAGDSAFWLFGGHRIGGYLSLPPVDYAEAYTTLWGLLQQYYELHGTLHPYLPIAWTLEAHP